jgi:hypothetical protein
MVFAREHGISRVSPRPQKIRCRAIGILVDYITQTDVETGKADEWAGA